MLHVRQFGPEDGVPVLMVHGVTGHGGRWQRLAEEFLDGFRVIAPDLRGHGHSPALPPWTLEQHAADLLSVLDSLAVTGLPVIGHSFGGAAAIHLARLAPQRVTKLVLLDPAIGLDPQFVMDTMPMWPQVFQTIEEAGEWQRKEWAGISLRDVAEELQENFAQTSDGRWMQRSSYSAVVTAWSEMCRVAQVPPPTTHTLLVSATQSPFVRPAFVNACQMSMRDSLETVRFDGGHMLQFEHPVETAELITNFLGR
ncbi:alpha/beta hydrolase [Kibdelosporangium philippinense]|uniref:Alpha/beta hydrolase n=1 Tax=Kibdelosporangium philippinense TaxID=211113 RepID=A0ABS8ZKR6_9PSEU|nr:alpha/beta hydrolase [Kibdelosporangium philippinense]MCE7008389.1 alpha/beta hydrolase [Kibdelosporangium philippinense]